MKSRLVVTCILLLVTALLSLSGFAADQAAPGKGDVYVVPFSHLDLYWAGTREECLARGNYIISKAIQVANKYPESRYLIEDEVWIANFVETHRGTPELEELKRLVKAGRIELAPKWAAIYQNLPRGESHVRNHIYGKRYAREVFGVDPLVSHLGDLPGYTWQYPQILAKSGIPYTVMTRMGPPDTSLFRWKSPDGTTALAWYVLKGYGWGVEMGLHHELDQKRLDRIRKELDDVQPTVSGPIYLGWGTDMFAPSEKVTENISVLNKNLAPWRFHMAGPGEYFRAASKLSAVPERSGEIPSSWANLLTTMFPLWPPTQQATDTLIAAEEFAAINHALGYADYPQKEFETLWKPLLESMDHNYFGQGLELSDQRKLEYPTTAILRGGAILRDSLRNIAERVQIPFARSTPIVVFNSTNWTRDDFVTAHASAYGEVVPGDIRDYYKGMRLVDETGASVPFQVTRAATMVSTGYEITFIARGVPSLGYKTYYLVPAEKNETFPAASKIALNDPASADEGTFRLASRYRKSGALPDRLLMSDKYENEFYVVTVDRATGGITVFDKALGRAIVHDMTVVGVEERGGDSLAGEPYTGREQLFSPDRVETELNDPTRTVVCIAGSIAGIPVVERLTLYSGLKKIDLESAVHWKQGKFMRMEQRFPYDDKQAKIRYGIPFGSAGEDDILPNSGPHQDDEVLRSEWNTWRQVQDWMFVGSSAGGFTISSERQLMILTPGVVRAGMMRGTYRTQEVTQNGEKKMLQLPLDGSYVFRYSLTSGKGDWASAKSYRAGSEFANPLIPVSTVNGLSKRELPPTHSFLRFDAENLVVSAVKKGEFDNSIIVRAYEANGTSASTSVEFLGSKRSFQTVNLLEEKTGNGDEQTLRVKPFEIQTVRITTK